MMVAVLVDHADCTGQSRTESAPRTAGNALGPTLAGFGDIQLTVVAERETARVVESPRNNSEGGLLGCRDCRRRGQRHQQTDDTEKRCSDMNGTAPTTHHVTPFDPRAARTIDRALLDSVTASPHITK